MPKLKQFIEVDVLDKAKEVFNEKGYNGTSMDDLVKATGLSRSSIYDTFGDKHGLFLKTLNHYQCNQQSGMLELLKKTDSPKKKLHAVFNTVIRQILLDKKKCGCLLLNAGMELTSVDEEVATLACSGMEQMENLFFDWIKEGQANGEISTKFSAAALARHFYNSFAGLRMTGRSRPDQATLEEIVQINMSLMEE